MFARSLSYVTFTILNAFLLYPIYWGFFFNHYYKLNIDKCFYVLTWSHSFYPLFFFDVVYPIYWYLDVEPSLPLVSTFHLPLPVSGARLQALTITACTSTVLGAFQMPVSFSASRCQAVFTAWDTGMVSSSSESAWVTASSTVGGGEGEWEAWLHGCLLGPGL